MMLATLLTGVLLSIAPVSDEAQPGQRPTFDHPVTETSAAAVSTPLRLRKLHLVRPDLIPYPIAYEIYC